MSKLFEWPLGKRAAVSLSFDDAVVSQLVHALPILEEFSIRGTFYVNPGEGSLFEKHIGQWRSAHEKGHEIGNHTILHPCSGSAGFITPDRALENWTLDMIENDILAAGERMTNYIPDLGPVSFAYPCGHTFVGEGASRTSYIPVVGRHFTVARGVGHTANDPVSCDLLCLSSWIVQDVSADQMIAMLGETIERGLWAIFCFHGIGGDHLAVDATEFEGLVRFLAGRRDEIWTDTVREIGQYVFNHRQANG